MGAGFCLCSVTVAGMADVVVKHNKLLEGFLQEQHIALMF